MRDEIRRIAAEDPMLDPYRTAGIEMSAEIWAGLWDGEFAIAWGLIPGSLLSNRVHVWTVSNPEVLRHCRKTFLRRTREVVAEIQQSYPTLVGYCARKTAWLDHLGARYGNGPQGFSLFEIGA